MEIQSAVGLKLCCLEKIEEEGGFQVIAMMIRHDESVFDSTYVCSSLKGNLKA